MHVHQILTRVKYQNDTLFRKYDVLVVFAQINMYAIHMDIDKCVVVCV